MDTSRQVMCKVVPMLVEIMYRNQRTSGSGFLKIFRSERIFALLSVFFWKFSESMKPPVPIYSNTLQQELIMVYMKYRTKELAFLIEGFFIWFLGFLRTLQLYIKRNMRVLNAMGVVLCYRPQGPFPDCLWPLMMFLHQCLLFLQNLNMENMDKSDFFRVFFCFELWGFFFPQSKCDEMILLSCVKFLVHQFLIQNYLCNISYPKQVHGLCNIPCFGIVCDPNQCRGTHGLTFVTSEQCRRLNFR